MSREASREAIPAVLIAVVMMILIVNPVAAAETNENDKWQFDLTLYLWLPQIDGTLGFDVPDSGDPLEIEPSAVLDNLQFGKFGFEARKNRWSAMADFVYLDAAAEERASVPISIGRGFDLDVGASLELKGFIAEMAGAYDVIHTERANLGVLVGFRYLSMETELGVLIDGPLPLELPTEYYSQKGDVLDGIVGIKGQYGRKWYVPYYLDLGTGGSEFTWQAMTGFGYRWRWGGVRVVYRYMSFDQGDDGFLRELSFGGPAVGVNFRF